MSIFPPADAEPARRRRSAGRAWLLSSVMPGVGQLYCGATARGIATLAVFVAAVAAAIFAPGDPRWFAFRLLFFFYAFAGLDAYLTARDHNRGIEAEAPANPRVAALLNFTTNGFGYIYLGHRKAGWLVVIGIGIVVRALSVVAPLAAEALVLCLAIHVTRLAKRERDEAYPPASLPPPVPSGLPVAVPYAVSGLVLLVYYAIVTLGQIMLIMGESR